MTREYYGLFLAWWHCLVTSLIHNAQVNEFRDTEMNIWEWTGNLSIGITWNHHKMCCHITMHLLSTLVWRHCLLSSCLILLEAVACGPVQLGQAPRPALRCPQRVPPVYATVRPRCRTSKVTMEHITTWSRQMPGSCKTCKENIWVNYIDSLRRQTK